MEFESAVVRRVTKRLLPFLILCYFVAYLDRSNLGIAALTMMPALGLSSSDFGFAAGIFFLGYVVCEIPSNIFMVKFGARKWIARIMVTWGILAAGMAAVTGAHSLYVMRVLLGIAEAGFFPGVIFYISFWFPAAHRARVLGYFMTAIPLSIVLGSPLSASILYMDGIGGLHGWQWLFILEAIPAVVLGVVSYFYLTDTPEDAAWLDPKQRQWLAERLMQDSPAASTHGHSSLFDALRHPKIWVMSLMNLGLIAGSYGIVFFLPQIVAGFGFTKIQTGLITAIPFVAGVTGMLWCGWHSDKHDERKLHVVLPLLLAAAGYVTAGMVDQAVPKVIALSVAAFGTYASYGPFWSVLPMYLKKGIGAAAGIATINTIGSLAGFGAPYLMGYVKEHTGSYGIGLIIIAAILLLAALLALTFPSKAAERTSAAMRPA